MMCGMQMNRNERECESERELCGLQARVLPFIIVAVVVFIVVVNTAVAVIYYC